MDSCMRRINETRGVIVAAMTERTTDVRARILRAAAELLAEGGREAVSTRAVSAAAGVQAPTLYRQFGDMRGLLDALALETLADYVRQKATREHSADPVEDLRRGWDLHVSFGLANPVVFALIYADPATAATASAGREGEAHLHRLVARVAEAGRLRVDVAHAVRLIASAGLGVTLSLIRTPPEARDSRLSETTREAVLAAILTDSRSTRAPAETSGADRVAARAVALRAVLPQAPEGLSQAERQLLGEWLDRLAGVAR